MSSSTMAAKSNPFQVPGTSTNSASVARIA